MLVLPWIFLGMFVIPNLHFAFVSFMWKRVTALDSHVKIAVKINIKKLKPKSVMFLKPPRDGAPG